jgi:adenosylcobyric acid synthase
VEFGGNKILGRPAGGWNQTPVRGYEIHHGVATITGGAEAFLEGCRVGEVWGTMWHGTFENDEFRRAWLARIAAASGSSWQPQPHAPGFAARRESMIDRLADVIEERLDLELIIGRTT